MTNLPESEAYTISSYLSLTSRSSFFKQVISPDVLLILNTTSPSTTFPSLNPYVTKLLGAES